MSKYRKKILVDKLATFVEQEIRRIGFANTWTIGALNVQADAPCVQWGTITLYLDNETFRKSFTSGRSRYFDDSEYDFPQIAHRMSALDAAGPVLDEDGKGGYCFDRMTFKDPFDILGYMSGPIIAESREEREERNIRVVILPEGACPTRIAL